MEPDSLPDASRKSTGRWVAVLAIVLLCAVVFGISAQSLSAPFILDDLDLIAQVKTYDSLQQAFRKDCYNLYRPVKTAAFYILSTYWMDSPAVWRLSSLGLYVLSIAVLYVLLVRIVPSRPLAFASTAVWATAPTQVSGLVWSSCINIQIMLLAMLIAVLFHDELQRKPRSVAGCAAFQAGIVFCYLIACFSYEGAVVLPALLLIWDLCRRRNIFAVKSVLSLAVSGAAGLVFLWIRHQMKANITIENESIQGFSALGLSYASAHITLDHVVSWLWPFGRQSICGPLVRSSQEGQSWLFLTAWPVLPVVTVLAWLGRRKAPLILFGLAWFMVSFLPMSNLLPLFNGPFADYYLILPSIGLAVALVGAVAALWPYLQEKAPSVKRIVLLLLVLITAGSRLLAAGTAFRWSRAWNSEIRLYDRTLTARPEAFTARTSLAQCLLRDGHLEQAEQLALEAVHEAPWFEPAKYVLISVYLHSGRLGEAVPYAEQVRESAPEHLFPWVVSGYLYEHHLDDVEQAIRCYGHVLRLPWAQNSDAAIIELTRLLSLQHKDDEALAALDQAAQKAPGSENLQQFRNVFEQQPDMFRNAAGR
jgi:tetratricopeptide (TPR) repeat protein